LNQSRELKVGESLHVTDVKLTLSEIINEHQVELYAPETKHSYEVGTQRPVWMKEVQDVCFQLSDPVRAGIAKLIVDAPEEIPVTSRGVDWGPPFWPRESLTSVERPRRAETLDLAS